MREREIDPDEYRETMEQRRSRHRRTIHRTYDDWKTDSDEDQGPVADCDCCGKRRQVSRCWVGALETWACEECRGE